MTRACTLQAAIILLFCTFGDRANAASPWIVFDGDDGPGKGRHIVFVTGDEEYRSEELMPQLAKILARHHGFRCTVLFAINLDYCSKAGVNPLARVPLGRLAALAPSLPASKD